MLLNYIYFYFVQYIINNITINSIIVSYFLKIRNLLPRNLIKLSINFHINTHKNIVNILFIIKKTYFIIYDRKN